MKIADPVSPAGNIELLPEEGVAIPISEWDENDVEQDISAAALQLKVGATIGGVETVIVDKILATDPANALGRLLVITVAERDEIGEQAPEGATWQVLETAGTVPVVWMAGQIVAKKWGP